ncbi:hypothetical protein FS837_006106 [Tulasnella sp. UAMH 9824]|nr:hypothetical protein FS837_006106 [Tulasnella sp. UAMH 9824]
MSAADVPTLPNPDSDHSDVDHDSVEAMRSVWMSLHGNAPSSSKPIPYTLQEETPDVSPPRERPVCRLVVISSGILSKGRTHAIIEPHDAVKVGRDKQPEPLLRLKELAVSKHHASIFWDNERLEWAIVDLGSVHGTWLNSQGLPGGSSSNEQADSQRLSAPRTSSTPRRLLHGDTLTIGSSKFAVHIHESGQPCEGCGLDLALAIPLLPDETAKPNTDRTTSTSASAVPNQPRVSHKAAMQSLRQTLLHPGHRSSSGSRESTPQSASTYQDRSRKRREMFGTDGGGSEAGSSSQLTSREKRPRYDDPRVAAVIGPGAPMDEVTPSSSQSRPIDESNIGHRLLMKKGWTPGETLGTADGDTRRALREPLQVVKREGQAGLGSR